MGLLIAIAFMFGSLFFIGIKAKHESSAEKSNHYDVTSNSSADHPGKASGAIAFGKVKRVIDGDTLIIVIGWKEVIVRLSSIDCPEDGQPWGGTAKAGLIKLVGGKHVRCEMHCEDHYGRTVATLYVKGRNGEYQNVNEKMVARGHAWVMRRYFWHLPEHRRNRLNRIEGWARKNRVGLWKTQNPVPPWRWRAENKVGRRG